MSDERASANDPAARKSVKLALQGGGAHGAFTWGALDRLLEDDRLYIEAISATSAGAMNGAVMAYGYSKGGKQGARAKLEEFWRRISRAGDVWSPMQSTPWERFMPKAPGLGFGPGSDFAPAYLFFQLMTQIWSPYQLNPWNFNPLKAVLSSVVDFDHLRACELTTRLHINATNVRTGKIRIFSNRELSEDVLLASACLPYLFQAVKVGEDYFWDGGYMGNPAIFPLIYEGLSRDVIVVHTNPLVRDRLPKTAAEVADRINEISFNSSLMREMRAIAFVSRLIEEHRIDPERYKRMLIHAIRDDATMVDLGVASKFTTEWRFLQELRDAGRKAAASWLETSYGKIGHTSSIDIVDTYL
jgi:NTE family protein